MCNLARPPFVFFVFQAELDKYRREAEAEQDKLRAQITAVKESLAAKSQEHNNKVRPAHDHDC